MKKIILFLLFGLFWICTITMLIIDFSISSLLLYCIITLPLTLFIVFKKNVPALFTLVLYGIFEGLMCVFGIYYSLVNKGQQYIFDIVIAIAGMLFFLNIILHSIRILRSKESSDKYIIIVFCFIYSVLIIISFFVDPSNAKMLYDVFNLISTILLYVLFTIYLSFAQNIKIEVFK